MSIFSTILADIEAEWAKIFGAEAATISQDVVTDIQLIGSGLSGALTAFEGVTGIAPTTLVKIQAEVASIVASASSVVTTVEANIAKPVATQIAADFAALKSALSGVTLPAAVQSVLNAVAVLLPYIEAAVGILSASTVGAAEATGLTVGEARLILKAA